MKKNFFIRIAAGFLALLMLAAALVACADKPGEGENTTAAQAGSESKPNETTASIYDENGYLLDKLPEKMNLGGDISLLYWSDVENTEFEVLETTGDLVENAIFKRDLNVQDRLGVTIVYSSTPGNNNNNAAYTNYVKNAINNGDTIDIFASYSMTTANIATLGLAENLLEYKSMDFTAPWWPADLINETTINNKLFFCSGDISTNLLYMMYTVFFNKSIISDFNLESPYDLVAANEWTFEKFMEMANTVCDTSNVGSSEYIYGFNTTSAVHVDPFFYGAGLRTLERGEDGTPVISDSWHSEKTESVIAGANAFLTSAASVTSTPDVFLTNRSLFTMSRAVYAKNSLANADVEFGIAVTPKYDKEQENYATCLAFPASLYGISTSSQRKEDASVVLEALASEGYRTVTPMLFEVSLKSKYAQDSETGKMFDLIRETVVFDLGRLYTTVFNKRTYQLFRNAMVAATYTSYSSLFKAESKQMDSYLKNLLKSFE
ncbi:MAG: hypothetical protein MJ137_03550 [Clostridia bacterium]|nr:hypothetical protein [Clostridia bacterium]